MVEDASWLSIFMHVLGTADLAAASDEVSAEVVGLANGDRRSVEAARVHLISSLSDHAATHRLAMALGYLDLALRRGDDAKRWRRRSGTTYLRPWPRAGSWARLAATKSVWPGRPPPVMFPGPPSPSTRQVPSCSDWY